MLGPAGMLIAAGGAAGGGGGGDGPTGPPTSVSMFLFGDGEIGIQWTNGDSSASTQLAFDVSSSATNPTPVTKTFAAGLTSGSTDAFCEDAQPTCHWFIRHIKNAQTTDWVLGTGCASLNCAE